jgi:hypothetical protein
MFAGYVNGGTNESTYDYLEIPLLLKVQTNLSTHWKGYFLAGPSLGFLLKEKLTSNTNINGVNYSSTSNNTQYLPETYWTLVLGGGVEFQGFILDIRYSLGLSSELESNNFSSFTGINNTGLINALCFQFGYRIL